ncbi:MAG: hypothetical protein Q9190_002749 [Brigantiaea leucoxantha]
MQSKSFDSADESRLSELNQRLGVLIAIFPHILPEVFREMLLIFDGTSGLDLVVDQLLTSSNKWVRGRWRSGEQWSGISSHTTALVQDQFRRNNYKRASKLALSREFNTLRKSTIRAVLAEQNHSYSLTRPVLQGIADKSWRHSLRNIFRKPSKADGRTLKRHYMLRWKKSGAKEDLPVLEDTGDTELNQELYDTVLKPLQDEQKESQDLIDWNLALRTNREEAEKVGAIFECECCFMDNTFEQIVSCSSAAHILCFSCLCRAVNEALFGQNWVSSFDRERGHVPELALRQALQADRTGRGTLLRFESRVMEDSLSASKLPLLRCPVCPRRSLPKTILLVLVATLAATSSPAPAATRCVTFAGKLSELAKKRKAIGTFANISDPRVEGAEYVTNAICIRSEGMTLRERNVIKPNAANEADLPARSRILQMAVDWWIQQLVSG